MLNISDLDRQHASIRAGVEVVLLHIINIRVKRIKVILLTSFSISNLIEGLVKKEYRVIHPLAWNISESPRH